MDILAKVKEIVAASLYLDDIEEIQPDSKLIADLGAESIDFLDIMFRLEEAFGVKLPKGELETKARAGLSDDEFAINGVLQAKGLERMAAIMSEVDADEFKPGMRVHDIPSLYTVQTFVNLVKSRLEGGSTPAPSAAGAITDGAIPAAVAAAAAASQAPQPALV
jgi:acyl carrier protein